MNKERIVPASLGTVKALKADIMARIGKGRDLISLASPDRSRVVALEANTREEIIPSEYYPVVAIVEQTLNGDPIFTHGVVARENSKDGVKDRTYIIFERGDEKLQAVVEANGPANQRMLGEEEAQSLRKYIASLVSL